MAVFHNSALRVHLDKVSFFRFICDIIFFVCSCAVRRRGSVSGELVRRKLPLSDGAVRDVTRHHRSDAAHPRSAGLPTSAESHARLRRCALDRRHAAVPPDGHQPAARLDAVHARSEWPNQRHTPTFPTMTSYFLVLFLVELESPFSSRSDSVLPQWIPPMSRCALHTWLPCWLSRSVKTHVRSALSDLGNSSSSMFALLSGCDQTYRWSTKERFDMHTYFISPNNLHRLFDLEVHTLVMRKRTLVSRQRRRELCDDCALCGVTTRKNWSATPSLAPAARASPTQPLLVST